ncbi:uncharacterized protein LOC131943310 isoform X2 [Physella acuta]|nr:uncharacterized protein LOC131943310 isoform X2 [Physella acuta]XP_059159325.1 uncharacterized protein LOC131943310 isoform X2 [Physella acuta]XP_059159327.1 uncharacterized protein LOC131943310 isoform X2 [Physella acuta]
MAALGFEVHVDKENAPSILHTKGSALKSFGLRNNGKLAQPTPRKALFDVNQDPRGPVGKNFNSIDIKHNEKLFNPVKPKVSSGVENHPQGPGIKKSETRKTPAQHSHRKSLKNTKNELPPVISATTKKVTRKPPVIQQQPDNDDCEYDSDTIFPRSERLSTYVDKLLAWRPPCLFGTIPDSDTDCSEPEEIMHEEICEMPVSFVPVPEFLEMDLENLMDELPPLEIPEEFESPEKDTYMLDQTPDTSLSLGSLQVMTGSLNASIMSDSG